MASSKKPTKKQIDQAKEALELLFATQYVDKKTLYKENFLRGLFFGTGTIISTAVVLTVILWFLSLLDTAPFVGPIVENIEQSVQENSK